MRMTRSQLSHAARGKSGRCFLAIHELGWEHNGKEGKYFCVTRGTELVSAAEKRPDAVMVVGMMSDPSRIVMTSEYRLPIQAREISFPAGLIEESDYENDFSPLGVIEAVKRAACREFFEETGLSFVPKTVSPPNLFSSAGMTNESVCLVIGEATGEPTTEHAEANEDIEILLLNKEELARLTETLNPLSPSFNPNVHMSKAAWPFVWSGRIFE